MKQSNLLNAQFARRLFRTAFSSWQLLAVMLIVCMNVAVGSKLYAQSNTIAVKGKVYLRVRLRIWMEIFH